MSDKDTFIQIFQTKYSQLYKQAIKNKYKVFIPLKKLITENMLDEVFYTNHIFYTSKYDENIFINLNGRVLKYEHPKFRAFLNWKKNIEFQIKDQYQTAFGLCCISIDNVCDEQNYNEQNKGQTGKGELMKIKKMNTIEEYLKWSDQFEKFGSKELSKEGNKEWQYTLKEVKYFVDIMKNNCIFMKGYEEFYSMNFIKEFQSIQERLRKCLMKQKCVDNPATFPNTVNELTESLVFRDMYDFFMNSLISFNEEEEKEMQQKMKEIGIKFELTDAAFKGCTFEKAIKILQELPKQKCVFEKFKLLTDVNTSFQTEAKDAYEKANPSKTYSASGDSTIAFWSYIVSHSKLNNILAEANFLKLFGSLNLNTFGESSYLSTTFISAVNAVYDESTRNDFKYVSGRKIRPNIIRTEEVTYTPEIHDFPERSMSVSSGVSGLSGLS